MFDPEENDRLWYSLIARGDQDLLSSLLNPKSARDYFLKLKSDPLLDHTRLYRVALRRLESGKISSVLDDPFIHDFENCLSNMSENSRMVSDWIPYGYVLNNQPEALCMRTAAGSVIIVSEVLRNALFFLNIGFCEFFGYNDIPADVRFAARSIAARTMHLDEALDFELDPRGIIPSSIRRRTWEMVSWQMQFVIGHEFAHHRLGHLDDGTISYRSFRGSKIESRDRGWTAVRRDWEHEFSADIAAIDAVSQNPARHRMAQAAILFMIYLAFVETMIEHSNVALRDVDTHPPTVERLRKLILSFGLSLGVDTDWGEGAVKHVKNAASQLLDHDFGGRGIFGWYGSVYLGQWRGPELVDRVDF